MSISLMITHYIMQHDDGQSNHTVIKCVCVVYLTLHIWYPSLSLYSYCTILSDSPTHTVLLSVTQRQTHTHIHKCSNTTLTDNSLELLCACSGCSSAWATHTARDSVENEAERRPCSIARVATLAHTSIGIGLLMLELPLR